MDVSCVCYIHTCEYSCMLYANASTENKLIKLDSFNNVCMP